jgi:hypothetical protein
VLIALKDLNIYCYWFRRLLAWTLEFLVTQAKHLFYWPEADTNISWLVTKKVLVTQTKHLLFWPEAHSQ